ncbi:MAG: carboxypeptidase-like regulatory domain-containing protein [Bacteroidetes bacterium]|nr:carboxypeptidase-like regulatory domain-containing protein [Bacteroidota bacterium]
MRKLILIFTLVSVLLLPTYLFADIYGTLTGKVVDAEGKGVVGATVLVQGTTRGTKVNSRDGSFTVTNITAGSYTVLVRSVGKQDYKVTVRMSADKETRINVTLKDEAVEMEGVTVTAVRDSKVDAGKVGSGTTITDEALTNTTANTLSAVVGMSAGVSSSGDGYAVRGSRATETQIRLDGMNMGNQFSGGFGSSGATYFPMASTYATEEVQVITGNFAAQYGDVQGGIVNSVMKTGRTDRYEGYVNFVSDLPFLSGSQKNNTELVYEGGQYRLVDGSGEGLQYLQAHAKTFDVGFGGPIGIINDRTTFYINVLNMVRPYNSAGYDLRDRWGNSLLRTEAAGAWMRNLEGRISLGITNDIKLVLGGKLGLTTNESTFSRYALDEGMPWINKTTGEIDPINGEPTSNGITQNIGKTAALNNFVNNAFARINHTLTDRSFYEITFSWSENNSMSSRKVIGTSNNYFTGYELMEPVDNWIVNANTWDSSIYSNGKNVGDFAIDWAQTPSLVTESKDGFCTGTFFLPNPLTGYYEGQPYSGGTQNPYGMANFSTMGGASGISLEYGNILSAAGHYNLFGLKTGEFTHVLKAGFEASYFTMHKHFNSQPYSTAPIYDIYTDKWGGNIYSQADAVYERTSQPMNQFKLAAYVQDQITFRGIVFNPGIRLDIMDPMNKYRILDPNSENGLQFIPISAETGFADASVKVRVSPRININYPITENSYISMSYGQFFQSPLADNLYNYFNLEQMVTSVGVGDPNMEVQLTSQYMVEYKNQLTDEFAISFAAYFKDIYNQLGVLQIQTTPVSYYQWAVSEYGSSKGIEVQVDKSLSNHFAFSLNYALTYTLVTATDASSNMNVILDPYSGKQTFPLAPFYANNDIRHTIKGYLFLNMGKDEGPQLFGSRIFQNMNLSLEPTITSGAPYTKVSMDGSMYISERNVYRGPAYWRVDSRLSKEFMLKDLFGESMGNSRIQLWVSCNNLFNLRGPINIYTTTEDPLDDGRGLNYTLQGNFSSVPWYKEGTRANPSTCAMEQYDSYGNRLYNEASDFDGNGIVTQAEKYEAYKRYYEEVTIQGRSNYQVPITFRAGVVIFF